MKSQVQIITYLLSRVECQVFKAPSLGCITPCRFSALNQKITSEGVKSCQERKIFAVSIPALPGQRVTDHRIRNDFYFLWEPFQNSDPLVCEAERNYFEIPYMPLCLCSERELSVTSLSRTMWKACAPSQNTSILFLCPKIHLRPTQPSNLLLVS